MLHRTVPFLQLSTHMFNDEWHKKWNLLDQSFQMVQQTLADAGKQIGIVFIEFMDLKFSFTSEDYFNKPVVVENIPDNPPFKGPAL